MPRAARVRSAIPAAAGISRLKQQLEEAALYKNYRRGVNAADGVNTAVLAAGMGMGIGLLSTIIVAPVVLGLEAAALACGLLGTDHSQNISAIDKESLEIKLIMQFGCISESRNCVNERV